jgi:hypothetical protein
MLWSGLTPIPLSEFGGLATLNDRMNLPPNMSPNATNVVFTPGSVSSRYGLTVKATGAMSGSPNVTGMANYINLLGVKTQMVYFYDPAVPLFNGWIQSLNAGSLTGIDTTMSSQYMFGASAYGNAWMTFYNIGANSVTPDSWPRKYNGTTMAQVGYSRPAATAWGANNAAGGGLSVTAGTHLFRITFEDATGATSPPGAYASTTVAGSGSVANTQFNFTGISLGPLGTVRRVIWATTASDGGFVDSNGQPTTTNYYTLRNSAMIIADNTSTTASCAFTDATLALGENSSSATPYGVNLFTMVSVLPPCLGVVFYKSRAFYYNLLGSITPRYVTSLGTFSNLDWKGTTPLPSSNQGWTMTITGGASLVTPTTGPYPGTTGQYVQFSADGTSTQIFIKQSLTNNYEPTPYFTPGVNYGVRARIAVFSSSGAGNNGAVTCYSNIGGTITTVSKSFASLTAGTAKAIFQNVEFDNVITGQSSAHPGPDTGLGFAFGLDNSSGFGTPSNGATIILDWLDFYPMTQPRDGSKVFGPQTIDLVTGAMYVQKDNGQDIRAAFVLRDYLYFVKERSIFVTSDNQTTEPSGWTITQIDDTIGCAGPNCVATAEGIAVIASRSGLYTFNGAIGDNLAHEIEPTWKRINWQYAATISLIFDTETKSIRVSVPLDAATTPSHVLVLNYEEGWGDGSTSNGHGRKWSTWQFGAGAGAASMLLAEQANGSRLLYIGCNDGTKNVYFYDPTNLTSDAGTSFTSTYETQPIGVSDGPSLFGGLLFWANGSGSLAVNYVNPAGAATSVGTFTLANPYTRDWQALMNTPFYEKVGFRYAVTGGWFNLIRMTAYAIPSPFLSPARGTNP